MRWYRILIALAVSIGFLHLHPSALRGQQVTPGDDPIPSQLLPYAIAGAEAAERITVSEFTFLSTLPAIPMGFAGIVALTAPNPRSGFGEVALAGLGLTALGYALAAISNTDPQRLGAGLSIDVPEDARNVHDDAFRQRLEHRRKRGAILGTMIGSAIGMGGVLLLVAILPST